MILLFQIPYSELEKALYSIILIILYSVSPIRPPPMGKSRMQVRIISKDYQKITDAIKTQINRGVTLYHIAGGYTGEESCEVMTILTSRELNELSDLVTEIDPKAFMTIARVNEARGRASPWKNGARKTLPARYAGKRQEETLLLGMDSSCLFPFLSGCIAHRA